MVSLYPYFYEKFQCKGADCKKTCCQRWEIDIDDISAATYFNEPGALGKELKQYIRCEEGIYSFTLNKEGYCHFLKDGLCRLVLAHGEEYLCDICHMHPRFFKYVEDLELCGVGLACEKSCELLLECMPKDLVDGDTNQLVFVDDEAQLYTLLDIIELLGVSIETFNFQYKPHPEENYYAFILDCLTQTEPIDEAWTLLMVTMRADVGKIVKMVSHYMNSDITSSVGGYNALYFNRLFQYILYRQLDLATVYSLESIIFFARMSTEFILMRTAMTGDYLIETANWSEQIEYDTENMDILLQLLDSKYKKELAT